MLAFFRARRMRSDRLQRFQGVRRWLRKTKSPGSLRERMAISRLYHLGRQNDDAGFRLPLGRCLVSIQRDRRGVQVDIRPCKPSGLRCPGSGNPQKGDELDETFTGCRVFLVMRPSAALISVANSASVMGRRGWP